MLQSDKNDLEDNIVIDNELNLPFGLGFDQIIKDKKDFIANNKYHNNQVMDELVEKLGYLDYRDALAANKYILEAKRHGDYHQQARAKTLSLALSRMNAIKQAEIEKQVNEKVRQDKSLDRDEQKLQIIMNSDQKMGILYREMYQNVKDSMEQEMKDVRALHDKFDEIYDKERMQDKLLNEWDNLEKVD